MTLVEFEIEAAFSTPDVKIGCRPIKPYTRGTTLVIPETGPLTLTQGVGQIDLQPTTPEFIWEITINVPNRIKLVEYVAVPPTGPVDYTALTRVDPDTLEEGEPDPAWWAALENMQPGPPGEQGEPGEKGEPGESGETGPPGPATTNADLLDSGTLPEARLPLRLTPGSLNNTFVRFLDLAGNPITARRVTIKVDTATWEIADIVAEA